MVWKNDPNNELLMHFGEHESFKNYLWEEAVKLQRDWEWS